MSGMPLHGCDLSRWNKTPSFDGIDFVFARASIGVYVDDSAERHLMVARSQNVPALGCYAYLRGDADGGEQASVLLTREAILGGGMMPAIDVEDRAKPAAPWDRKAYALTLRDAVRHARSIGRVVGTYGSRYFLEELYRAAPEAMSEVADVSPLWLASWGDAYPWDAHVPLPWTKATMIQIGAKGGIDQDVFNGTVEELRAVFGLDDTPAGGMPFPGPC